MIDRTPARPDPGRRAGGLVDALSAVAGRFALSDRTKKLDLLRRLAASSIGHPRVLLRLHETLCFLQAYPDDRSVLHAADRALAGFARRIARLQPAAVRRLRDSGIAGTTLDYPFGFPMTRWLVTRFSRSVSVRWAEVTGEDTLEESLVLLLHRTEHDAFSDEGGLGWRRWLAFARNGRDLTDLELLLELFGAAPLDEPVRDWLFESLALPIEWRHEGPGGSRTLAKLPWRHPFFHGGLAFRRPDEHELIGEIDRPLPSLRQAPPVLARRLIEAARLAMATRQRELFAFSYANPADVLVADPGRGLRIALIGIVPTARLPYEGYYAYLALKNGVPVGYGAGWQLFDTLELAVNVFESFRQGESAFIVSQVLRAYRHLLGMRTVVVDAYQIGRGNTEALRSGAFYFYYRLGFRPDEPAVARLAEQEQMKIARDPAYRSPPSVLERLARCGMSLSLAPDAAEEPSLSASRLAMLVTMHIARCFRGDRRAAAREAEVRVARSLGVRGWTRWSADERWAFAQLSLPIALIPDLDRWSAGDRRRLVEVVRAKGGASEAEYVRRLCAHRRLRRSLGDLVRSAEETGRKLAR